MVVEPRTRNHRRRDFHPDVFLMPQPTVDTAQTPSTGDILLKQTDSLRTHTSGTSHLARSHAPSAFPPYPHLRHAETRQQEAHPQEFLS